MLAACLHLLATFGLECRAFACKKIPSAKKWGGGASAPPAPPRPPPMEGAKNWRGGGWGRGGPATQATARYNRLPRIDSVFLVISSNSPFHSS